MPNLETSTDWHYQSYQILEKLMKLYSGSSFIVLCTIFLSQPHQSPYQMWYPLYKMTKNGKIYVVKYHMNLLKLSSVVSVVNRKHCSKEHFLINIDFILSFIRIPNIAHLGHHHTSLLSSHTWSFLSCCPHANIDP